MRWFGTNMDVVHKSPDQPLTQADLEADSIIREMLIGARPAYGWLSEETADSAVRLQREMVWIVDPIDGTRSFIAGRPEFSISIGLAQMARLCWVWCAIRPPRNITGRRRAMARS